MVDNIEDSRRKIIDRIAIYVSEFTASNFDDSSSLKVSKDIRVSRLFVLNGVEDTDAVDFLSESLKKWRNLKNELEARCKIKVEERRERRRLLMFKDSKINENFKVIWLRNIPSSAYSSSSGAEGVADVG